MEVFEFCDMGDLEAFVLASDVERAKEIFQRYLLARGVDADDFLYRDFQRQELGVVARTAVDDSFSIGREGLVVSDATGSWVFITPVGGGTAGPVVKR
jgi:hypothetical protein